MTKETIITKSLLKRYITEKKEIKDIVNIIEKRHGRQDIYFWFCLADWYNQEIERRIQNVKNK